MSHVFYSILCLGMVVGMYLSQDVGLPPSDNLIYDEEKRDGDYQDFDETQEPESANDCYIDKMSCMNELAFQIAKPICVYKKTMGLINYVGVCEIKLQYCLNKQQEKNGLDVPDEIYHNGKTFDCHYYLNNAKSEKQAVSWYFMLGGRDAQTESITTPII